jgi:hypothetical protein
MQAKTKTHSGWNRLLIIIFSISLILGSLLAVFKNNFSNGAKTYLFLKEANAYENISELAKVEINNNLPDSIKSNFIKKALIEKVIDTIITPENVSKIAEPGLVNLYKLSDKAASLASKKIEFDTVDIKKQAEQYLPKLGLSTSFTDTTLDFVKSVPDTVTIINVEKNPNSPLAIFLKIRAAHKAVNQATDIVWLIALLSLIGIIIINIKNISRLLSSIYWPLGVSGALILAITYILPPIALSFMPSVANADETSAINNLVSGLINNYLKLVRGYGWIYLLIALIALIVHWLINSTKAKELFSKAKDSIKSKAKKAS